MVGWLASIVGQQPARPFRNASEPARRRNAELVEVLPHDGELTSHTTAIVHVVNGADVDSRAFGLQAPERREEIVAGAADRRDMDEIDTAVRSFDTGVGHEHGARKARRLPRRPTVERAETYVIAERDVARNDAADFARRLEQPPGFTGRDIHSLTKLWLQVSIFDCQIPLNRQLLGGD